MERRIVSDLVPPAHQAVLFISAARRDEYRVFDHLGVERLTTSALGLAYAVAQRIAADHGCAWITCVDGSIARIGWVCLSPVGMFGGPLMVEVEPEPGWV